MFNTWGLLVVAAIVSVNCAPMPELGRIPAAIGSVGSAPLASSLIGTWRLVSFESRLPSGDIRYPMSREVVGRLNYDAAGNVSTHLMDPTRPVFVSGDRATGTDLEVRAAFVGYLGYFGTYTVDAERGTVTHRIDGASFPNWVGGSQLRRFRLDGERLAITTPPIRAGGEDLVTVLIWERTATGRDRRDVKARSPMVRSNLGPFSSTEQE